MAIQTETKSEAKQPFKVSRAKCGQCGKELRYVPFALNNIMCRDCYGLDRYRRAAPPAHTPEKPVEVAITDEEASNAAAAS